MAELLRLILGDKRNPSRTLNLASSKITMMYGGFSPGPGAQTIIFDPPSVLRDGGRRLSSTRENATIELRYKLVGGSVSELAQLQRDILRFAQDAQLWNERRQCGPVWLEYRWDDGLSDVNIPAPVLGQWSHYLPVLALSVETWPDNLHTRPLVGSNSILGVVAQFVVGPYSEGLRQAVANGQGLIRQSDYGILVGAAETNAFTNPSFGHSTWNNSWTAAGGIDDQREIWISRSYEAAARLGNASGSAANFTQTLTLTATTYLISCYCRRLDGEAVTSSDMQLVGQGSARTTTFEALPDGWYLAYATFTGAASSSTHGVQVKAGKTVIVDDFTLVTANYLSPFFNGDWFGCAWSGTAHASTSTATAGKIQYTLSDEMENVFSVSFWFTPLDIASSTNYYLLYYYSGANDYLSLRYQPNTTTWTLTYSWSGTSGSDTDTTAMSLLTPVHCVITRDADSVNLYLDGTLAITVSTTGEPVLAGSGASLFIGSDDSPANQANGYFDGLRIWRDFFNATEALALYTTEVAVKTNNGILGLPPVFWTEDGDGNLENVTGTVNAGDYDSTGVLFGVPGDVSAETEWWMGDATDTAESIHFGVKSVCLDEQYQMAATTLFLDFNGTSPLEVDAVSDEIERATGTVTYDFDAAIDPAELIRGRYLVLARLATSGDAITAQGAVWLGSTSDGEEITTDELTIADSSFSYDFHVIGDLVVDWPDYATTPTINAGLITTPAGTISTTVDLDFVLMLPHPYAIAEGKLGVDTIVVSGTDAWTELSSGGSDHTDIRQLLGGPVNAEPNRYNWLWLFNADDGDPWDIGDTGPLTFTVYITPRWTLPGGPVA